MADFCFVLLLSFLFSLLLVFLCQKMKRSLNDLFPAVLEARGTNTKNPSNELRGCFFLIPLPFILNKSQVRKLSVMLHDNPYFLFPVLFQCTTMSLCQCELAGVTNLYQKS